MSSLLKQGGPLGQALQTEIKKARKRFHVPAHAGQNFVGFDFENLFQQDLTELPTLDVLGNPQGVLAESQNAVADLYQAAHSFYLVNGASTGIMAALLATGIQNKQRVLVARNCHRSVIQGLILTGSRPRWILPEQEMPWGIWGKINPESLSKIFSEHSDIAAFVMTHPTYEGIASDIAAISEVCKKHQVMLIVDEAHGSLWPISERLPQSALEAGADCVVHSMHKSGGSLTQTGLLHLSQNSKLQPEAIQEALNTLQTTSPSYVLLANLEATCLFWPTPEGKVFLNRQIDRVKNFKSWANLSLKTIRMFDNESSVFQCYFQSSKMSGEALGEELEEEFDLSFETATPYGTLMNLNPGLPDEALADLKNALTEIDTQSISLNDHAFEKPNFALPETTMSPREAFFAKGRLISRNEAIGKTSKQVVASCPPGIPVVIPGEVITKAHTQYLPEKILVVAD